MKTSGGMGEDRLMYLVFLRTLVKSNKFYKLKARYRY
jgi:hypothetical protein